MYNDPYSQPTTAGPYPQFPVNPGPNFSQPPPQKPPLPHEKTRLWQWYKRKSKAGQLGIGCGTLIGVLLLCGICGAVANAGNATEPPATAQVAATTPTLTIVPTKAPAPSPTPIPTLIPTPMPTPTPTQAPVKPAPVQQSQPEQSAPAPATGVNGNPWGYDFNPGNHIYSPPSAFCSYFNCIASFWNGKGYVEECSDTTYSKSGGISGSCSKHGGDYRPLYSH